jgi:N-acetylglucosamine-6-phosphate deacetylase
MYAPIEKEVSCMKTLYTNASFWQYADGRASFVPGELLVKDGVILERGEPNTLSRAGAVIEDLSGARVAPGLIDVHTHGRAGADFTNATKQEIGRASC